MKACKLCGKRFHSRDSRHVYCCRRCMRRANAERERKPMEERACVICGKPFVPPHIGAGDRIVACSPECRLARRRERHAVTHRRRDYGLQIAREAPGDALLHDGDCSRSCRTCRLNEGEAIDDDTPSFCVKYAVAHGIEGVADVGGEVTLQSIGDAFGLCRERIRQIEVAALAKLARRAPDALRELLEQDAEPHARPPRMERWRASEQSFWTTPHSQFSVRRGEAA